MSTSPRTYKPSRSSDDIAGAVGGLGLVMGMNQKASKMPLKRARLTLYDTDHPNPLS